MSAAAIAYVGCVDRHGADPATDAGGAVGGDLGAVAAASLPTAHRRTEQNGTPMPLQDVIDCLEVALDDPSLPQPERTRAADVQRRADKLKRRWAEDDPAGAPTLFVSRRTAPKGTPVAVSGARFGANETVNLAMGTVHLARVVADRNGAFSAVVITPPDAPASSYGSAIVAVGGISGRAAQAPLRAVP
jgi:hypothetical protein